MPTRLPDEPGGLSQSTLGAIVARHVNAIIAIIIRFAADCLAFGRFTACRRAAVCCAADLDSD